MRGNYVATVVIRRRVRGYLPTYGVSASLTGVESVTHAEDIEDFSSTSAAIIGTAADVNTNGVTAAVGVAFMAAAVTGTGSVADLTATGAATATVFGAQGSGLARNVGTYSGALAPITAQGASVLLGSVIASADVNQPVTGVQSAAAAGTPQAYDQPPVQGERLEFADIPEITFVRGFAENEELGIYVIDPLNRTEPGDMWWRTGSRLQRHTDHGGGPWTASHTITATALPAGVTFNSSTCVLTYDGTGSGSEYTSVTLTGSGVTSRAFKVRVVVPTVVYGDGATALNTDKSWGAQTVDRNYTTGDTWDKAVRLIPTRRTYDNPGVLLVTRGTYSTADGEDFYVPVPTSPTAGSGSIDHFYILGEPTVPGVAWNPPVVNSATSNFRCTQQYNQLQVIKNLQTHGFTFPVQNTYNVNQELTYGKLPYIGVLSKVAQYDTRGTGDAIGSSAAEADSGDGYIYPGTFRFVSNVFQENVGGTGSSLYHMMYQEGRPNCKLRINNHRSNAPDKVCSSFQTTAFDISILNTWVSVVKNADPANGITDDGRSVDLFDLHQCNYSVVYNCKAYTGQWRQTPTGQPVGCLNGPIMLENRRAIRGGNDVPPYPNLTWQVAAPFLEFTNLWESIGDLTGATYTTAVPQIATSAAGPWTSLSTTATIVNTNAGDWNVTLAPADLATGIYWFRLLRSDNKPSRLHHLKVYKSATTLAVSNYWNYEIGLDANGFDLDAVETFVTDDYWLAVKATNLSDPTNPYTYKHYWAYNTFEWLAFQYPVASTLMRDKGMGPVRQLSQGSAETYFMRANPNFQERSCHFFANNKLVNAPYSGAALFELGNSDLEFPGGPTYLEPGTLVSMADINESTWVDEADEVNYVGYATGPGLPKRRVVYAQDPVSGTSLGNNFDNPSQAPIYVPVPNWMPLADPRSVPTVTTQTELEAAAAATTSGQFSAVMNVPSLNTRTPRLDTYNVIGTDYPSNVGGTTLDPDAVPLVGRPGGETRAWIWGSRMVWDSTRRMVLGIYSPHLYDADDPVVGRLPMGPTSDKTLNQYTTVLFTYRETDNAVQVYEAPLNYSFPAVEGAGFTSHLFDNTCIRGRTLYKMTTP